MKRKISVVTPCFNEEENVELLYSMVKEVMTSLPYDYEHLFIDNASTDSTASILRKLATADKRVKVILNARNFGHIRSPYHAMLQTTGDAVILIVADLQDPPGMIPDIVRRWEDGFKIVLCVKEKSREGFVFSRIRKLYYRLVSSLSDVKLVKDATGFGLYDRDVMEIIRKIDDPYPYFRGMLSDIGFPIAEIKYTQPARYRGFSKNNLYTLYDLALLGITNHSKVPLRIATFLGFGLSAVSMTLSLLYLALKLMFWDRFPLGTAPMLIGIFFFGSLQLFFIGILGEYVGAIHTQVLKRPLVIEKERINFD